MNKIWIIIKREYFSRVKNKTFLLSTILLPVMIILFIAGSVFFAVKATDSKKVIAVNDKNGMLFKFLKSDTSKMQFVFNEGVDTSNFEKKGFDGILFSVDSTGRNLLLKTVKAASNETMDRLKTRLNSAYVSSRLLEKNITREEVDSINTSSTTFFSVENTDEKNMGFP